MTMERKEEEERVEGGVVVVQPKPNKGITLTAIDWLEKVAVKLMYGGSPTQPHQYLSGNFAPVPETPPCKDLPVKGYLPVGFYPNRGGGRGSPSPPLPSLSVYRFVFSVWVKTPNLDLFCVGARCRHQLVFAAMVRDVAPTVTIGDGAGVLLPRWSLDHQIVFFIPSRGGVVSVISWRPIKSNVGECLNGEFVRVGPNPKFAPVAGYHWMIHGLRIKDGKATYVSRYVKTSRLKQEEFLGGAKFTKIGDLKGLFGLLMFNMQMLRGKLKVLDLSYGHGTDVVKVLEDGDLQTLGMFDYDKRLAHSFTAHPKVDPFTGEMFTFGYSTTPPYITYRVTSKDGFMQDPVPITISEPIMMHDFAITENYAIIMDLPMYFRPKWNIFPMSANSWEEGDEVVLITCRIQNPNIDLFSGEVEENLETDELYEMRFNMKTGQASQKKLSVSAVDFPRVNESYTGRKQQFVYGTMLDSITRVTGIIKFDLHAEPESGKTKLGVGGNVQGIFDLGPGRFGSEAIFVPRKLGISSEEDDGYLIFFVHDEASGKSAVNVIDAKTMSADPVAVVELPNRVPYGFHALFVTEEQLQEQAKL
ncbi:hypothetical protein RHMOL_Rhmol07G0068900 [Rhododendron molle]|uniref:Uncharacterized protein n=1 Tax=Rhododendron molle TaxID=49168 RepID=A0ACC0MYL4_RHOML|nr:hypothetical protein RHMOL_Rhmol07G0068900 [Rhododendron molle]